VEGGTTLSAPLDGLECCTLLPLGEVEAGSTLYIFLRAGSKLVRIYTIDGGGTTLGGGRRQKTGEHSGVRWPTENGRRTPRELEGLLLEPLLLVCLRAPERTDPLPVDLATGAKDESLRLGATELGLPTVDSLDAFLVGVEFFGSLEHDGGVGGWSAGAPTICGPTSGVAPTTLMILGRLSLTWLRLLVVEVNADLATEEGRMTIGFLSLMRDCWVGSWDCGLGSFTFNSATLEQVELVCPGSNFGTLAGLCGQSPVGLSNSAFTGIEDLDILKLGLPVSLCLGVLNDVSVNIPFSSCGVILGVLWG